MTVRSRRGGRGSAQIMVLFGLALPAILLMVGLSIDVGNIYFQHRVAQIAADAAALAGVRCLYQQGTNPTSIAKCRPTDSAYSPATARLSLDAKDAIEYWVWKNSFGITNTIEEMVWLLSDGTTTAIDSTNNLAATSPSNAQGVKVTVKREFSPYLLQTILGIAQLPSTIATSTGLLVARASAQAKVGVLVAVDADFAPLAACGEYMIDGVTAFTPTPGPTDTPTAGPTATATPVPSTVTVAWDFAAGAESWLSTETGDTASISQGWSGSDGSPASGSLEVLIDGSNKSGTNTWYRQTTWEGLTGKTNITVTAIRLDTIRQRTYAFSNAGTNSWTVELQDGSGTLQATLLASQSETAAEGSWSSDLSGSTQAVPASIQAGTSTIRLAVRASLATDAGPGADQVGMRWDHVQVTITYTSGGGTPVPTSTPAPTTTPTPTWTPQPGTDILGGDGTTTPYYVPRLSTQYGMDFILQSSQMEQSIPNNLTPAPCPGIGNNSSWKGRLVDGFDSDDDGDLYAGQPAPTSEAQLDGGNTDAPIAQVCIDTGQPTPTSSVGTSGCYLLMPVAIRSTSGYATIVSYACFQVWDGRTGVQRWRGTLVEGSKCPPYGRYGFTWTKTSSTAITRIMLTE